MVLAQRLCCDQWAIGIMWCQQVQDIKQLHNPHSLLCYIQLFFAIPIPVAIVIIWVNLLVSIYRSGREHGHYPHSNVHTWFQSSLWGIHSGRRWVPD